MSYASAYDPRDGVAIIGMAGRFPGAENPRALWRNLAAARESIPHFAEDELEPAVAYRGRQRWVRTFEAVRVPEPAGVSRLRPDGSAPLCARPSACSSAEES